jgi:anti-anti-sigma factor
MEQLTAATSPGLPPGVRALKITEPFLIQNVFEFQSLVREKPQAVTIVDLTDVPYMDSAALGALLGLHISCQRLGHKYALIGPSQRLLTLFEVGGVADMLVVFPTMDAAIKGLT